MKAGKGVEKQPRATKCQKMARAGNHKRHSGVCSVLPKHTPLTPGVIMDFSSLPRYRSFQELVYGPPLPARGSPVSPREARLMKDLALLMAIVVVLYQSRQAAAAIIRPPSPPPLDFRLVAERYALLAGYSSREEVERLLGPPTECNAWAPEIAEFEKNWRDRNGFGEVRMWYKWSDPDNSDRWVAVVYSGSYPQQELYGRLKKGL